MRGESHRERKFPLIFSQFFIFCESDGYCPRLSDFEMMLSGFFKKRLQRSSRMIILVCGILIVFGSEELGFALNASSTKSIFGYANYAYSIQNGGSYFLPES